MVRLEGLTARMGGGTLIGNAELATAADRPPSLSVDFDLSGATVTQPVFDLPLDLAAGRLGAHATLTAAGYSPNAMLATLGGNIRLDVQGGTLTGVSLQKTVPDAPGGEVTDAAARAALSGGATPFERLTVAAHAERGVLTLDSATLTTPEGNGTFGGQIDLPDHSLDLKLAFRPAGPVSPAPSTAPAAPAAPVAAAAALPEVAVRLTGPMDNPQRAMDLSDLIRWRAARAVSDPPIP